jgi:VIT1/CCC1 family predicted Fe2+/Mn2+ transporter
MEIEKFAQDELKDFIIYSELKKMVKDIKTKNILKKLANQEFSHYKFWSKLSTKKHYSVSKIEVLFFKIMMLIFGLTFTLKLLENHEKDVIKSYKEYLKRVKGSKRAELEKIIKEEEFHESNLINIIKEERVTYLGASILGLNDGLVEITGVLAGLTAALQNSFIVAISALITGIAASMSMAASSYLQSKAENKNPKKSAYYTGLSYIFVVLFLVLPYFLLSNIYFALFFSIVIAISIVSFTSFYIAVIFEREYKKELMEMFTLSLGIALITFIIGILARTFLKIEI